MDLVHGYQSDVRRSHDNGRNSQKETDLGNGSPPSYPEKTDAMYASNQGETAEQIRARELQHNNNVLHKLRQGEDWLDAKMGIETQGIDIIHEEDKKSPSIFNVFLMWWSMTCHVGTIPIGMLGPEFGLSLGQSVAGAVVGTILGALCTAYCGTLGPKLGLCAIATSRYSSGFYGAKLCSVLNVLGGGFAVVNVVLVGQILSAVSDYKMTLVVGCIIIAVIGYAISVFGFALIHTYEKYSWIIAFILLLVLIGEVGGKVDPSIPPEDTGLIYSGSMLSFIAICFSSASTPSWKIFSLTLVGVSVPTVFTTVIGVCLGNIAISSKAESNTYLSTAYKDHGLGGLLREAYHPLGFSKFCLIFLVFSVIGNNVAVNYSSGLSLQLLGHYFYAIPRSIWSFINALVIAVLAIAGREHLSTIVSNFVSLLRYWTVSFTLILLIEDKFFRRKEGYNLADWNTPSKLPWGAAAVKALLVGYCAGGVTGMSQTWFVDLLRLSLADSVVMLVFI